ncbi:hypothetical protein BS50DRAFT_55043 [Corynespora cassiicola Philippines]|uniref:Calcineurin-like phosphoesterase domain-containing protein n=1 Tax=Corynespora cassiicola Philippines TaxID=1448308 RepID=A0A2T2NIS5_CORCC|nr:hypothetical protein BS50DRAFT_55043 [Corynespora cassiicola Philippines]
MQFSRFIFYVALLLAPVAFVGTTWLYLYPVLHGCGFPQPPRGSVRAPFRLLALGDPQLEGDSSLPDPTRPSFPSLKYFKSDMRNAGSWRRRRQMIKQTWPGVRRDALKWLEGLRKRLDLWGNDLYLAHIVRSLRWWTGPSHVAVLGDLLGSQWVSDGEFERRAGRYWDTVFKGMERVPDEIMLGDREKEVQGRKWGGTLEVLGDDKRWENRVINIVGNHDIGYAGDIDEGRVKRFEKAFGSVNWDIVFTLPAANGPEVEAKDAAALRIVVLNSMNLDTPAWSSELQRETYDFLNYLVTSSRPVEDKTHATILLTHIPLLKEPGICVDSPYFDFFESGQGVREQNMLSDYASKVVLESIFGLSQNHEVDGQGFGRRGIIIDGHDHEGCDVLHWIKQPGIPSRCPEDAQSIQLTASESVVDLLASGNHTDSDASDSQPEEPWSPKWEALRYPHPPLMTAPNGECVELQHVPSMREITLRSMMGDFSGYAGFLSAWFDESAGEKGEWQLEFNTCGAGVQHWWWAVHIIDLVLVAFLVVGSLVRLSEVKPKALVPSDAAETALLGDAGVVKPQKK